MTWNKGKGKAIAFLREHAGHIDKVNCVIWPFSIDRDGYGMLGHDGVTHKAHRWMCEATHGPAPSRNMHAAHECGNGHRGCVNPHHIVWKTPTANARVSTATRCTAGRPMRS